MLGRTTFRACFGLFALCLLALAGSSPAAAAEWSTGTALTDQLGSEDSEFPVVAVAPDGAALAVWRDREDNSVRYASRPAGGSFSGRVPLEAPGASTAAGKPAVALNSAGAAVVAWTRNVSGEEVVEASYRPAGGSFSAPVTVSPAGQLGTAPDVAISAAGKAVVVWSVAADSVSEHFAEASVHGTSGGFSAAEILNGHSDSGYLLPLQARVAMDGDGNAIVVFPSTRPGGPGIVQPIQWTYMTAGGSTFGVPQDLEEGATPDVAFSASGRATVVWQKSGVVRAAEQVTSSGGAFAASKRVSAVLDGTASKPDVGVDGAGNATVVYQVDEVVKVATRPQGGSFGTPVSLSSSGESGDAQVAVDAAGNAAAAWTRFDGSKETVEGSYRPAGADFGAPKTLTKTNFSGNLPAVAIDGSGAATAIWQTTNFFGIVWTSTYSQGSTPPPPPPPPPGEESGGGGGPSGGSPSSSPAAAAPVTPAAQPSAPTKKALKCPRGKVKKSVRGKQKCVKAKARKRTR